jgi:hypothetical protein
VVSYLDVPLKHKAFVITETELILMEIAAIIGDNNCPVNGYRRPAANGIPSTL